MIWLNFETIENETEIIVAISFHDFSAFGGY